MTAALRADHPTITGLDRERRRPPATRQDRASIFASSLLTTGAIQKSRTRSVRFRIHEPSATVGVGSGRAAARLLLRAHGPAEASPPPQAPRGDRSRTLVGARETAGARSNVAVRARPEPPGELLFLLGAVDTRVRWAQPSFQDAVWACSA
jgi:hypothetical protein